MSKKMLIDARHPEEIRVAVLSNGKVEDFDFESAARKPLRGNIYLARVTRVEPSLQAAFVEYGGNRHGFLAFGEIHPDYYQIPVADRDVLRQADALEAELAARLAELDSESLVDGGPDRDDDFDAMNVDAPVSDDDAEEETTEASDDDGEAKPRGRDRRRGGRRRRRGRGRDSDAQSVSSGETDADDILSSEDDGDIVLAPSFDEGDDDQDGADRDPDMSHDLTDDDIEETSDDLSEDEGDIELVAFADDASDDDIISDDDGDDPATGPDRMALEDQPDARLTQDLDDDADVDIAESDAASGLFAENDDESGDVESSDGNAHLIESDDAVPTDAPVTAKQRSRSKKTPEQLEAERLAAERAAEINELRKKYDAARREREKLLRNYRIQEVIKRRQIMLVQVVKEERGNKGAALTTYMSLAGRYGVLMPNNARGGGVSRKITNAADRKRLRQAIAELNVPKGQGLIIRTAGAKRTKAEIKRDYDYLARLWDTIRDHTLKSIAPCLIYEEASLIKRAIRDLYDKDTADIIVEGDDGYREAKDFMKMLMPSHAKFVQPFRETVPLFLQLDVERQLDEMYQPIVHLKSGGYLVIQQTEALISIDVNSGKATKERSVEATALKTNSEAAVEVARQCRLRDLAGLLVVDFIDMEESRNNRVVEKKLKDAMKADRARIQIGQISSFGLLELSRQRRRSGIVDGTTRSCPTCNGAGAVRSVEMAALRVLRTIEETAAKDRPGEITLTTSHDVALYILNHKRAWLHNLEAAHNVMIEILTDHAKTGDQFDLTRRGRAADRPEPEGPITLSLIGDAEEIDDDAPVDEEGAASGETADVTDDLDSDATKRRRRRRRGRRGPESESDTVEQIDGEEGEVDVDSETAEAGDEAEPVSTSFDEDSEEEKRRKRRRRGRRGGRKARRDDAGDTTDDADSDDSAVEGESSDSDAPAAAESLDTLLAAIADDSSDDHAVIDTPVPEPDDAPASAAEPVAEKVAAKPAAPAQSVDQPKKPRRSGWWSKALGKG